MAFKENDCVKLLRPFEGEDLYFEQRVSAPAGELATIVNVFPGGCYEVEFMDKRSKTGWGILYAEEVDLELYQAM